jgi:peptide/nickel transport system substrate-binding protein
MHARSLLVALFAISTLVTACAPASSSTGGSGSSSGQATAPQRLLQIINRGEPPSIAAKPVTTGAGAIAAPRAFFNATFEHTDTKENHHPQIVEALPEVNTDSWRINADGTMETRYTLKPNLTWHDGTPLNAQDFAFAHRVYKTPEFGTAASSPMLQMEDVIATDARNVVIKWNRPYVDAGLMGSGFQALPRHILEQDFGRLDPIGFSSHAFWTSAYIGLGPYKLDRWEPGSFLAGSAFDNYALGRPKIDNIEVRFINDAQTALANALAGEAHYVMGLVFSVDQGATLEREWARMNVAGKVLYSPTQRRLGLFQMRPEYQSPKALSNANVRYAVAHALDHQSRVDVLDAGKGAVAHSITHFGVPWYAEVDRAVLKHDYNPRAAEMLMNQSGWTKGTDGFFVNGAGERFTMELESSAGGKNEQETAVYADSLRRAGFEGVQKVTPVSSVDDLEYRGTRPGLSLRGAGNTFQQYVMSQIPTPENRWRGNNRGGWSNPEYDRTFAQLERTFPLNERAAITAQLERLISIDRAITMNTWESEVYAVTANLVGAEAQGSPDAGVPHSNIHEWRWTA